MEKDFLGEQRDWFSLRVMILKHVSDKNSLMRGRKFCSHVEENLTLANSFRYLGILLP